MSIGNKKIKREAISFASSGNMLYGMIHLPVADKFEKTGIVILSAGLKNRIGFGRINISLADALANSGYPVMRYDYPGCGDSQGHLSPTNTANELHADINGFIQTGMFVPDTMAAMAELKEKSGCSKFILCGLCGGSNSSLYTSVKSDEVASIILLNLPVALDSNLARLEKKGELNDWQKQFMYETYLQKIFSPRSWLRVLALRSDFKSIFSVLKSKFGSSKHAENKQNQEEKKKFNFNDDLLIQFEHYFKSGRRAYLVFSENDPLKTEYEKYFEYDRGSSILKRYEDLHQKLIIRDSNHSFTNKEWRDQLFGSICEYVKRETG